jgi:signal transduction histidine kinase
VVFFSLVAGMLLQRSIATQLSERRKAELQFMVDRISECTRHLGSPAKLQELSETLQAVIASPGVHIAAVFDVTGRMLGSSLGGSIPGELVNGLLSDYGLQNSEVELFRFLQESELALIRVPVLSQEHPEKPDRPSGSILLAHDARLLADRMNLLSRQIWTGTSVMGGLAALLAFLATRHFTRPILDLASATARVASGNQVEMVEVPDDHEVGQLATQFNDLVEQVSRKRHRLIARHGNLKAIVDRKTRRLDHALQRLQKIDQEKDQFLSCLSHEVRTPLTNIRSAGEILAQFGREDPGIRDEFVPMIEQESRRLDRLLDNFTVLTDLDHSYVFTPGEDGLYQLVRAAIERVDAAESAVQLLDPCTTDRAEGQWDSVLVAKLTEELIRNAQAAAPDGTSVQVELTADSSFHILSIRDVGRGVPADERERVFERFYQSGDVLTDKPEGSGLGLAICRKIMTMHSGDIAVLENSPAGCLVRVRFPAVCRLPAKVMEEVECAS